MSAKSRYPVSLRMPEEYCREDTFRLILFSNPIASSSNHPAVNLALNPWLFLERDRQTDRRTDRQTDKQTSRQTDREGKRDREIERERDSEGERERERQ